MAGCLDRWMSELPPEVRRRPLNRLAIPGSHDSLSYSLGGGAESCPAEPAPDLSPAALVGLYRCAPRLARPLLVRWVVTQQLSVTGQLAAGVRYLDVRAALHGGRLHVVHGLHGPPLAPLLADVRRFLADRPGELVILDLQHVYGVGSGGAARLSALLSDTFGDSLVPRAEAAPSLEACAAAGQSVLAVYRGGSGDWSAAGHPLLWDERALSSPWPDTQSVSRLFPLLERHMARAVRHAAGRLHVQQCVLTPQTSGVLLRAGSSMRRLAENCNSAAAAWLPGQSVERGLNIVMLDFVGVGEDPLVEMVVKKNYER
ncbi:PI-PLC X domain-containing protein 3 [Amphibalanus amphitrite]|uniref:PI-PLC X domain-containing protein 3 n=1 Tax=Amphibalanus amphitrite TaxID=1232801 RepID=A0A6A4X6W6_AMPAM|nr:PI-PLC X domain-containing protein 3 [Amphibalanus amphitrite]